MLTTIEAEIDVNGSVTFLEPLKISRKSRAIITLLDEEKPNKRELSAEEAKLAEDNFARWMGSVSSGNPRSADNEQIDADLAKEYGATHDGE